MLRFAVVSLVVATLAACGGGGDGGPAAPSTFVVTATAQSGGTIAPASATVAAGATASFTVTPSSGYSVAAVTGCGGSLAGNAYTTSAVAGDCSVTATFVALDFHVIVSGNSLGGLVLENNAAERIVANSDGRFDFATGINIGAAYSVRIAQQPVAHVCRVANGTGVIATTTAAVDVRCVSRVVSNPPLYVRTAADANGQFQQTLYFRSRPIDLHQFRVRATEGVLEDVAPVWSLGPFPTTFTFSPNGERIFADDGVGNVVGGIIREADGAVIPAWTAIFGEYSPQLPLALTPPRASHDGRLLYRNVTPIVNGIRYDDLWVGAVDDMGLGMLAGSPFALGNDGGLPTFDPSGRYLARLLRGQSRIEVYEALLPSTVQPVLLHQTVPVLPGSNVTFFTEEAPGRYLYEASFVSGLSSVQVTPHVAVHAWQDDGSLSTLGGALAGVSTTVEIAGSVCVGTPTTSRSSFIQPLPPGLARPSRYLLQSQNASCFAGTGLADNRVLGVHLLRVVNGEAALTTLPLDVRAEWGDLGAGGWVHPTEPWLYLGSKHSERVYGYAVDEATATVQPLPGSPFAVVSPPAPGGDVSVPVLLMDPTRRLLFLARSSLFGLPSTYVASFAIDATTGALTPVGTYTP